QVRSPPTCCSSSAWRSCFGASLPRTRAWHGMRRRRLRRRRERLGERARAQPLDGGLPDLVGRAATDDDADVAAVDLVVLVVARAGGADDGARRGGPRDRVVAPGKGEQRTSYLREVGAARAEA